MKVTPFPVITDYLSAETTEARNVIGYWLPDGIDKCCTRVSQ